jgi:hemolysin activation/secretion protein
VAADDPDGTVSGFARYERPVGSLSTIAHARVVMGAFDWEDPSTRLDGDNLIAEVGARHQLTDNRVAWLAVDGAFGWQRLGLDPDATEIDDDRVWLGSLGLSGRRVSDLHEVVASGRIGVDVGTYLDGGPEGGSSFVRLIGDADAWTLIPVPGFAERPRLSLRFTGQAATEPLPGTLELGLGGPARTAAFDPALVSVDDGAYLGVDLAFRSAALPWGELRVFADVAYGEQKRSFDDDLWAFLADTGVALNVALPMGLASEVRWSFPLSAKGEDDAIDDEGARWLWMLSYRPEWVR